MCNNIFSAIFFLRMIPHALKNKSFFRARDMLFLFRDGPWLNIKMYLSWIPVCSNSSNNLILLLFEAVSFFYSELEGQIFINFLLHRVDTRHSTTLHSIALLIYWIFLMMVWDFLFWYLSLYLYHQRTSSSLWVFFSLPCFFFLFAFCSCSCCYSRCLAFEFWRFSLTIEWSGKIPLYNIPVGRWAP